MKAIQKKAKEPKETKLWDKRRSEFIRVKSHDDTIQEMSDSDFCVKFSTFQFYAIEHNSKSNHWSINGFWGSFVSGLNQSTMVHPSEIIF